MSPENQNQEFPADGGPTPPLSLRDAESIVQRLAPALREHEAWVRRIQSVLICRTAPEPDDLGPDGHLRSALGRWFCDEPSEYIRRHPEYRTASTVFEQAHAQARMLCQAVDKGVPIPAEQYEHFAEAMENLGNCIDALIRELWDLLRYTDPLTGLATRFAMVPRLKQEYDRLLRTGHPCSICMIDLDHFKDVNDTYGHQAGDAVLEAVSSFLLHNLRRYDQIYRYGGEEFLLMLPDTAPKSAFPVVERLRSGVADLAIQAPDGTPLTITASFGIAGLSPGRAIRDIIDQADQAMYAAKAAGGNTVEVWREPLQSGRGRGRGT